MPRRWGSAQTAGSNLFTCQFYFQENFTLLHTFAPKYRFFRYTSGYFDKLVCFPKILYSCSKIQQLNNPFFEFFWLADKFWLSENYLYFSKNYFNFKIGCFSWKTFRYRCFFLGSNIRESNPKSLYMEHLNFFQKCQLDFLCIGEQLMPIFLSLMSWESLVI